MATPSLDRGPRLTSPERRVAIVAAARSVFARRGYAGASTAEIAGLACCSEPLLYKHFPSKHALFLAVLEDMTEGARQRIERGIAADPDPISRLRRFADRLHEDGWLADTFRLRSLGVSMAHDEAIRATLAAGASEIRAILADGLRRGQAEGRVRSDVDADQVAWLWVGLTFTVAFRHALGGDDELAAAPALADTLARLLEPPPQED
jgi:AcrR family transcriptional regulator